MSLKQLRENLDPKPTQTEVAKRAGITLRQYQRYENNESPLSTARYKTINALAELFNVSPSELIAIQRYETSGGESEK